MGESQSWGTIFDLSPLAASRIGWKSGIVERVGVFEFSSLTSDAQYCKEGCQFPNWLTFLSLSRLTPTSESSPQLSHRHVRGDSKLDRRLGSHSRP